MSTNLCDKIGSNTGDIKCDARKGRPVIPVYGGKIFDLSEYATPELFKAALKAAMNLPTGDADKLFALPENVGMDDKTTAPKEGTLGSYGPNVQLIGGRAAYEFDLAIGTTLEKKFLELNGEIAPFFIWDDKRNFWGADDGEAGFKGYDCMIAVISKPFEDGKDARVTKFKISIISQSEFEMDGVYVPAKNLRISDFKGLADISLRTIGIGPFQSTLRIATERGTSVMGKKLNIFPDYKGGALASPAAWYAKRLDTMAAITVQAVSINESLIPSIPASSASRTVTLTDLGTASVLGVAAITASLSLSTLPADGDTTVIKTTDADGTNPLILASYVKQTGDTATAIIAALAVLVNADTATSGYSMTDISGPNFKLTSTPEVGAADNGRRCNCTSATNNTSGIFAGGVTPVEGGKISISGDNASVIVENVERTPTETTLTQMAAKVALTINTETSTNGGYTATSTGAVITIHSSAEKGGVLNGTDTSINYAGGFSGTSTPWAGGVYASDEVPAGEGFGISLNRTQVDVVPSSVKIEVGVRNVTTIQALGVKGIEVMNAVEYEVA